MANGNQLLEQNVEMFADDNEVKRFLGIPSENFQSLWGHQEMITETYEDVIQKIDFDQLLSMDIPEEDGNQNVKIDNIGSSLINSSSHFSSANPMMFHRDPMISQGTMSTVKDDGCMTVKKRGPVILQQRISSDSSKKTGKVNLKKY